MRPAFIEELPVVLPAAGRFQRLSVGEISEKYRTANCEIILTDIRDWFGVFDKNQLWYCNKHKIFFRNSVRHVVYRNKECTSCQEETELAQFVDRCKLPEDYLLLATKWKGKDKKYLFFCMRHARLAMSRWHDIITKKQKLVCCYSEEVYGKVGNQSIHDTITKYITERSG